MVVVGGHHGNVTHPDIMAQALNARFSTVKFKIFMRRGIFAFQKGNLDQGLLDISLWTDSKKTAYTNLG